VDAFKQLHEQQPALASNLIHFAWKILFESGEYSLCSAYVPNSAERYEDLLHVFDESTKASRPEWGDDYLDWVRSSFKQDVEMLTTILRRTGRESDAVDIEARLVKDQRQRGLD
jgi:hypothetical protein